MIVTEHYVVCDVCNDRFGPYETPDRARNSTQGWFKINRGVRLVEAHNLGCAKIALDDAEELFKNWLPIASKASLLDQFPKGYPSIADVVHNAQAGKGDYMAREYGGKHTGAEVFDSEPSDGKEK